MGARRLAMLLATAGAIATPAAAVEVTSIKISSALPDYLQISEVVATQAGTGADVALASAGATASATSTYYGGTSPDYAIDGVGPAPYPQIYHSAGYDGTDYLLVTLAQAFDLSGLTIDGRPDAIGTLRDDYAYQLFDGTTLVGSGEIDARNAAHSGTAALPASAAPEPSTWALMIGGLGLAGATLRRRRAAPRFA